jgi:cold shock CspA family protein
MYSKSSEYHGLVFNILAEKNQFCLNKLAKVGIYRVNTALFWIKYCTSQRTKGKKNVFSFSFNEDDKLFLDSIFDQQAYLALVCVTDHGSDVVLLKDVELQFVQKHLHNSGTVTVSFKKGEQFRVTVGESEEKIIPKNRLSTLELVKQASLSEGRIKGYIHGTHLAPDKGYGFIKTVSGENIFFHQSELLHRHIDYLEGGEAVEFSLGKNDKGLTCAINITFLVESEGERKRRDLVYQETYLELQRALRELKDLKESKLSSIEGIENLECAV